MTPEDLSFKFANHISMRSAYYRTERDEKTGIEKEIRTQRIRGGYDTGNVKISYYYNGKKYKTIEDVIKNYKS